MAVVLSDLIPFGVQYAKDAAILFSAGDEAALARFETIKRYRIIKKEFSQETGELTPSLKVKRNVIRENYADLIASMYADG